jgi:hypothetical protein
MAQLGQASGGWTESSSALRVEHAGIFNSTCVLVDDAFTQTNPPIVTVAATISDRVDQTKLGVLSGSVAFTRPDDADGNAIGGPNPVGVATALNRPCGVFVNDALGNAFENTPGVASGKNTYMSGQGTYANRLFETQVLALDGALGAQGADLAAYLPGMWLYASRNGYITHANGAADLANQCYEGSNPTIIGLCKMGPDATQNELVYDQRI